jgi:hypothetical protein
LGIVDIQYFPNSFGLRRLTAKIAKDAEKKIFTFTEFRFQQGSRRDFHNERTSALYLSALLGLEEMQI